MSVERSEDPTTALTERTVRGVTVALQMMIRNTPLAGLVTRFSLLLGDSHHPGAITESEIVEVAEANIVSSEIENRPGWHKIVLDIDLPVVSVPSSTPGHFHLYIDHELMWEDYERLLFVMADIGLLEEGYVSASHERKFTALRLPWVKKDS